MLAVISLSASCLLCALVFFFMTVIGEKYGKPICFRRGDGSLGDKIKDIPCYNADMSVLYRVWAAAWMMIGLLALFFPRVGLVLALTNLFAGVYIIYRFYKRIVRKYS